MPGGALASCTAIALASAINASSLTQRQIIPQSVACAALILVQAKAESPESQGVADQLLQQVYGMTPAEARLALLILDGQSPGDAANHLKVSVATVRTQLSSVLKKNRFT